MTETGINAALSALQGRLPRISKDLTANVKSERTGAQFKYSYADLAQISRELLPLLSELGMAFVARPTWNDGRFVLAYELLHTSGEFKDGEYPLPDRGTPQEIGSAITYARRYCLCAVTGLAPDDDDHDAVAAEKAARRQRREPQQRKTAETPKVPSMNSGQQLRMQKLFGDVGMKDRTEKLQYAREVVQRDLASASELTSGEADMVIEKLERWAAQEQPPTGGEPA